MRLGIWLVVVVVVVAAGIWAWNARETAALDRELAGLWEIASPDTAFAAAVDFLNRHDNLDESRAGEVVLVLSNAAFEAGEIDGLVAVLDSLRASQLPRPVINRLSTELHDALVIRTIMSPTEGDVPRANEIARELLLVDDVSAEAYRMMASIRAGVLRDSPDVSDHWLTVELVQKADVAIAEDPEDERTFSLDSAYGVLLGHVSSSRGLDAAFAMADSIVGDGEDATLAAVIDAARYRIAVDSEPELALAAARRFASSGDAVDYWYIPFAIGRDVRDRGLDLDLALSLAEWSLSLSSTRRESALTHEAVGWTHHVMGDRGRAREHLEASVARLRSAPRFEDSSVRRLLEVYEVYEDAGADEEAVELLATIVARSVLPNEEACGRLSALLVRAGRPADDLDALVESYRYAGVGRAPDFTAAYSSGGTVSLEELRGRIVLLNLWSYG
ncbi:MAG: hypothetical protein ABIG03_06025 [Candidatus Eisenbacteria bacterium]